MSSLSLRTSFLAALSGFVCASASVFAADAGALKKLSIEELMDVEVYSASRHLESLQGTPSATYVLTNDDIRRSRVTSVPEALRLVPGVEVGRVDANKWAISMRGFNSREANKLLVLVDGRSIYDPLFSGTLWESQDVVLEDIDRIEVIRGPGGTLWGANAFNGIINIVTRSAQESQGTLLAATAGSEETYTATGRFGWQLAENQYARFYLKGSERDTGYSRDVPPYDASRMKRGGFRWDGSVGDRNQFRVSGDVFEAETGIREDPTLVQDIKHRGKNLLGLWNYAYSERNSLRFQTYVDRVDFESVGYTQDRTTVDFEFQQTLQVGASHLLVWGGGYRRMSDDTRSGLPGFVDVLPLRRDDELSSAFVQETLTLLPDLLKLTLGLKYEETDYADPAWLPNVRLAWTPSDSSTWWLAASEATRVPSRLESDLTFFGTIRIGDGFEAEHVRAYEMGHRRLLTPSFSYDVALFYNDYDDLRSGEAGGQLRNLMFGHSKGAEVALRWQALENWQLNLAYAYLDMNLGLRSNSTSNRAQLGYIEGLAARHTTSLRSSWDLTDSFQMDATLRYVEALPALSVAAYTELDVGVTWALPRGIELSLVGQNLLESHHAEQDFAFSGSGLATEVQRSAYGRATWRF